MCEILKSDVWLLLILAAVFAAILVRGHSENKAAQLAAFFTVLGDAMILLSLGRSSESALNSPKTT